jgi:CII-binding regulator of phage lambda lysogenization HflD
VSLKKAQNANGINYSQAVFALAGKLSPEQTKAMAEYSQGIKSITRQLTVQADEYMQASESETNIYSSSEDDIPF